MLRHLLDEGGVGADDALPSTIEAPRLRCGRCAQARGDHAPYVGLREPVRDWSWEGAVGHRVAAVAEL